MDYRVPSNATQEEQKAWQDVFEALNRMSGSNNWDLKGRRLMNTGDPVQDNDYVNLRTLRKFLKNLGATPGGAIIGETGGGGGGGGGGGAQGCSARNAVVDAPDEAAAVAILDAYTAANPGQLENSCLDDGGNSDWILGAVAALQADDPRWGFCGQRGDATDIAEDAVTYYCGDMSAMVVGSNNTFVYDIIASHCPQTPAEEAALAPKCQDVSSFACGAWVQFHPSPTP